jgi:lipopolysaccharide biosynthesis glycosyltransferase
MFLLEKATFLEPLQSSFSARLPPTVQNMPESSSRNSPRVRQKQSKFDFNCAVDLTPIQLLVVSDRQDNKTPLLGFVNSILMYTSHPVHLHIVTRQTAIPWVDSLESEYFHVTYHLTPLAYSKLIASRTNFKTDHYSSVFAMVKLFIPTLSFAEGISKVLVLDDDMVFYRDLYPLYELVQTKPHQLSLFCPEDSRRVETYYTRKNMTGNGHPTRYCISGMMGIPVQPQDKIVDLFENTLANMNRDYPGHIYSVADQDVVNRAFADHHDNIDLIPCQWSYDSHSCMKHNGPCSNCNMAKLGNTTRITFWVVPKVSCWVVFNGNDQKQE